MKVERRTIWRIARRFAALGLAVAAIAAAATGSLRDSWHMVRFPQWGGHAPGVAPILALAAACVVLGVVEQDVMRLFAGSARGGPLARRPRKEAEPSVEATHTRHMVLGDFESRR